MASNCCFCHKRRCCSHFYQTHHFSQAALNNSAVTEAGCLEVSSREFSVMFLEDIYVGYVVLKREYMLYLQQVHQHRTAYRGWESGDETTRISEEGTNLQLSLLLK